MMKTIASPFRPILILPLVLFASALAASAIPHSVQDAGLTPADIQDRVNVFIAALGGGDNGIDGGPFSTGYRHVDWDGVPDNNAAENLLPPDYYNTISPVGLALSTDGTGLQVSAAQDTSLPVRFGTMDDSYTTTFQTYSPERLFTPLGSTVTDVYFFVPGSPGVPAYVSGFGAVFTDVDDFFSATIDFYGSGSEPLYQVSALPADGGLSFAGAYFDGGEQIERVRITSGNTPLGSGVVDGDGIDVVVMDDFYFGEPMAVPEPSGLALFGLGLLGCVTFQFWRSKQRG